MAGSKLANLKKTYYYLKRNGLRETTFAALERLRQRKQAPYEWSPVSEEVLCKQREEATDLFHACGDTVFSVLVPVYHTPDAYFVAMVQSVLDQSYPYLELIIADAGNEERIRKLCGDFADERIVYLPLESNEGISQNTNRALDAAHGDYMALLDHDDLLTKDALYENAKILSEHPDALMVYSDEDKCDGDARNYFEPNYKPDFDFQLLLSNNYICHLTVMKADLMRKLRFRKEFDGAQDHDLVLRAGMEQMRGNGEILHIGKVLYHWRCHDASTAQNPQSKQYAYDAGLKAAQSALETLQLDATVTETQHLGFCRVDYKPDLLHGCPGVGMAGGKIISHGKVRGGICDENGACIYDGLPAGFSGYLHRARCVQTCKAVDIRSLWVTETLQDKVKEAMEAHDCISAVTFDESGRMILGKVTRKHLKNQPDVLHKLNLEIGRIALDAGLKVVWDPGCITKP